jgi:hypothetical protein
MSEPEEHKFITDFYDTDETENLAGTPVPEERRTFSFLHGLFSTTKKERGYAEKHLGTVHVGAKVKCIVYSKEGLLAVGLKDGTVHVYGLLVGD